jgi:hypothetical protein
MKFKAWVKDKTNKQYTTIESDYNTKTEFIKDLRANGYAVNPYKVKISAIYDYIINETNCTPYEWKYINEIPNNIKKLENKINNSKETTITVKEENQTQSQNIDFKDIRVTKISKYIYFVQSIKLDFEMRMVIRSKKMKSITTKFGSLGDNNNLMRNFLYFKDLIDIDQIPELITESTNTTTNIEENTKNKTVEQNIKIENINEVTADQQGMHNIKDVKENKLNSNRNLDTQNSIKVTETTKDLHDNTT